MTSSTGTTTPNSSFDLETVHNQTISSLHEYGGSNLTQLNIGQEYDLFLTMYEEIPLTAHTVTFEGQQVSRASTYVYSTTYIASGPSGERAVSLVGARDNDSFVYNIPRTLQFLANILSGGNFWLNTNVDTHYNLSGSSVTSFANPGISSSSITGSVSRQTLSSGKFYFNVHGTTIQMSIVNGQSYNEPFTLWLFGFWSTAPGSGGYPWCSGEIDNCYYSRWW